MPRRLPAGFVVAIAAVGLFDQAAGARVQAGEASLKIVRAYEAWRGHDPANAGRTALALARYDAECGTRTGPFELLRSTTTRDKAAEIVRQIEAAGVPRVIEQAHARAAAALPGPAVTACVYVGELSGGLPHLGGVGGVALGGGLVKLFLHPTAERFAKLPYTVAHEYHHEVQRVTGGFSGFDDVPIREGKADHFAVGLYPALRPPHTTPLADSDLPAVWHAFQQFRAGAGPSQGDFMIAARGPLPIWAGYKLGFEMVGYYLQTHRISTVDLLKVPSDVIVDAFARSSRVARAVKTDRRRPAPVARLADRPAAR